MERYLLQTAYMQRIDLFQPEPFSLNGDHNSPQFTRWWAWLNVIMNAKHFFSHKRWAFSLGCHTCNDTGNLNLGSWIKKSILFGSEAFVDERNLCPYCGLGYSCLPSLVLLLPLHVASVIRVDWHQTKSVTQGQVGVRESEGARRWWKAWSSQ